MLFKNKGKWFNESEDTDKDMLNDEQQDLAMEDDAGDLLAEDELDLADEDIDDDSEGIFNDKDEACKQRDESIQKNEDAIMDDLVKALKQEKIDVYQGEGWIDFEQLLIDLKQAYDIDDKDIPRSIIKQKAKQILGSMLQ